MRIPRLYTPQPLTPRQQVTLDQRATHYLVNVLRLKPGREVILFNGEGGEFTGSLIRADKRQVEVALSDHVADNRNSPLTIHLGIAISKGERMDFVMQKAAELGATSITPLFTARVDVRLNAQRRQKKQQHWEGVIIAACEQCGRNRLPALHQAQPLEQWLQAVEADCKLVLHHRCDKPLASVEAPASVALLIGPEGGLEETEIGRSQQAGFQPWSLGPRVLRTETAPLAALAILQSRWGDM